jgi:DNA invertase Pin-like site-specific DNA recombinase
MRTLAYLYSDPTYEAIADPVDWGQKVDQIYEDADAKRSQLQALLKDVAQSPPHCLILRRLEELGDSLTAVTDCLTQLETLGICVIALEQQYRSAPDSELGASGIVAKPEFLELLNTIQQQQRSRKIRQGHGLNRLKGLPPPGRAPYGYRRGRDRYIIDRTVTPVVRDFFEQFLLYGSLRGAVRYIEKKHGKKISVATGQRWLRNPVYRGDLEYKNKEVLAGTHMPIVTGDEAAQVDRLLRRNRNLAPRAASAPRSLSGLVACQLCQSPMSVSRVTARRKTREYLYLRPMTCPQKPQCRALKYDAVFEKTIEQICEVLPQAIAGINQPPLDQIKAGVADTIHGKQQILEQLPDLVIQHVLDEKTANLRAYTLKTEIAELQGKLAQLPPVNLIETAKTVSIPQFWLDLSESERRFYLREFIRGIELVREGANWSVQLNFIF